MVKSQLILLVTAIGVFVYGCKHSKNLEGTAAKTDATQLNFPRNEGKVSQIAFLTMQVKLADSLSDRYEFKVDNIMFADGVSKKQWHDEGNSFEHYYLYCEILDGNKNRIDLIKVQDPLKKVFEYSNETTNALEKKLFRSNSGSFTLRFNFTPQSKFLAVYKAETTLDKLKLLYYAQF